MGLRNSAATLELQISRIMQRLADRPPETEEACAVLEARVADLTRQRDALLAGGDDAPATPNSEV